MKNCPQNKHLFHKDVLLLYRSEKDHPIPAKRTLSEGWIRKNIREGILGGYHCAIFGTS
jgi:hypothetical protein